LAFYFHITNYSSDSCTCRFCLDWRLHKKQPLNQLFLWLFSHSLLICGLHKGDVTHQKNSMVLLRCTCISYIVSFNDMFRLSLWAIFRLITFLSKEKYTISNAIVIVTTISRITYKNVNINTIINWVVLDYI